MGISILSTAFIEKAKARVKKLDAIKKETKELNELLKVVESRDPLLMVAAARRLPISDAQKAKLSAAMDTLQLSEIESFSKAKAEALGQSSKRREGSKNNRKNKGLNRIITRNRKGPKV